MVAPCRARRNTVLVSGNDLKVFRVHAGNTHADCLGKYEATCTDSRQVTILARPGCETVQSVSYCCLSGRSLAYSTPVPPSTIGGSVA